jgi:hypothetical protein
MTLLAVARVATAFVSMMTVRTQDGHVLRWGSGLPLPWR